MIARMRKAMEEKDQGFTLIELLVVMIIIGILAAIAIPVFLSQREKARDTAARSDVSVLGKEIATHYVDNTAAPTVGIAGGNYVVNGVAQGRVSEGVSAVALAPSPTATDWCVAVTYANGTVTQQNYSAEGGLARGACV